MTNTTSNLSSVRMSDYPEFKIGSMINLITPPPIIIFGIVGNVLSFVFYGRKAIERNPICECICLYMRVLAFVDSAMLVVLFVYWLHTNFLLTSLSKGASAAMCYGFTYIVHTLANCSYYVLVSITLYRLFVVAMPLKKTFSSLKSVRIILLCVGATSVLKNLHWIWSIDFIYDSETHTMSCQMGILRRSTLILCLAWFETIVSSLLPFLLIILSNTCIVIVMRHKSAITEAQRSSAAQSRRQQREHNVTLMVMAVSVMFLVFACPYLVNQLYAYELKVEPSVHMQAKLYLSWNVCQKLYYTNNALNFYVYALFGQEFRNELKKMIREVRRRRPGEVEMDDLNNTGIGTSVSIPSRKQTNDDAYIINNKKTESNLVER